MSEKYITQLGMRLDLKTASSLDRMAKEAGQTVTTVARELLIAAVRQAENGTTTVMPPYLRRFYGQKAFHPESND